MVKYLYKLYILFGLANTVFALDPNSSVIKRLSCTAYFDIKSQRNIYKGIADSCVQNYRQES